MATVYRGNNQNGASHIETLFTITVLDWLSAVDSLTVREYVGIRFTASAPDITVGGPVVPGPEFAGDAGFPRRAFSRQCTGIRAGNGTRQSGDYEGCHGVIHKFLEAAQYPHKG
ncbi:hypothetical protein N9H39_11745 [Gammaproteobacteria bacterium]|nr:hypothetical protein [Gammaproteobacteria bacterium]